MEIVYRKVFVKSEADLPEREGRYFVKLKGLPPEVIDIAVGYYNLSPNCGYKEEWLDNIDWYLQPVELPSDEEIERWIDLELKKLKLPHIYSNELLNGWMIFTAKRFRDKLINK